MANLSIREAVKHFDVSRPTLTKALNSGKISGVQNGKGEWSIDPAEVARLYRARTSLPAADMVNITTANTHENNALEARVKVLEAELSAARALAEERASHIDDLRRLLPAAAPKAPPSGFFRRLFGG
jgi:predicted site-specific integrase-resolvase